MSKYSESFCGVYGDVKCETISRWTRDLKDAQDKARVKKEMEDVLRHRKIAKEVQDLIN